MNTYSKKNTRILVVDDVLKNIQVIGKILREQGFLISVAQSGKTALEIIKKDSPDLILLDIIMPQMNGFETCRRLKEDEVLKNIPVIFLSALSETKDKVKGFKIGAVDYITKPIETAELLARIDLHLTLKSLQENLEQQVHIRTQELLRINEALKKRDEDYRSVMKAVPDPIIVYDLEGRTVYSNPAFTRIFGWTWEELDGKKPGFVVDGEWEKTQEALKKTYKKGYITDFETRRHTKQGKILDVSISGASYQNPQGKDVGIVVNLRDITEWKQTQEIMIQNEKMMSLGGLAAGMAHEIKNPLSAIIQNSQVLQNRLFDNLPVNIKTAGECNLSLDAMRDYLLRRKINSLLDSFLESGQRVNTIIDNMLSFSRKSESKFIPCDIAELMDKTIVLAEQDYDLKKNYGFRQIKIIRKYERPLPKVLCEGSKIQQVFFNILKNGSEAMNEAKKRALDRGLETKDSKFTIRLSRDKDLACIEIEDNGPGMNQKTQKRIFEPFYTTKGSVKGTGLGLSVSYFIIKNEHKGHIAVKSTVGKGTKFIIHLLLSFEKEL